MKIANILTLIATGLFLCTKVESSAQDYITADTVMPFVVDNYPVTNDMLRAANNHSINRRGEDIYSLDNAWFTNEALNQTLVFELYTDLYRMVTFHFYNSDVPEELINRIVLHTKGGDVATLSQKAKNFNSIINLASFADKKYFTTNKGLALGDSKEKVLSFYGDPDISVKYNGVETLEWNFMGDIISGEEGTNEYKRRAKNSFGHQAKMFFRNDVLIALILHNDIP